MPTLVEVGDRREKVAEYMRRSIFSPKLIAKALGEDYSTIKNDQRYLRKQSRTWLTEMAVDGLVHDTQLGIEAFKRMEQTLQNMLEDAKPKYNDDGSIKEKGNPALVLAITRELRETIDVRLETEANGPTLMALRGGHTEKED